MTTTATTTPPPPLSSPLTDSKCPDWPSAFPRSCFPFLHLPPEIRHRILTLVFATPSSPFSLAIEREWMRRSRGATAAINPAELDLGSTGLNLVRARDVWRHTGEVDLSFTVPSHGGERRAENPAISGKDTSYHHYIVLGDMQLLHRQGPGFAWLYRLPLILTQTEHIRHHDPNGTALAPLPLYPSLPLEQQDSLSVLSGWDTEQPGLESVDLSPLLLHPHITDISELAPTVPPAPAIRWLNVPRYRNTDSTNVFLACAQLAREGKHAFWDTNVFVLNFARPNVVEAFLDIVTAKPVDTVAQSSTGSSGSGDEDIRWMRRPDVQGPLGSSISPWNLASQVQAVEVVIPKRMRNKGEEAIDRLLDMVLKGTLKRVAVRFEDGAGVEQVTRATHNKISRSHVLRKLARLIADPDLVERKMWVSTKHRGEWCEMHEKVLVDGKDLGCSWTSMAPRPDPSLPWGIPRWTFCSPAENERHGGKRWLEVDWRQFVTRFGNREECSVFSVKQGFKW